MSGRPTPVPITEVSGVAVPFRYANVDTDAIFPVSSEQDAAEHGYGAALFGRWRVDPQFILNRAPYRDRARILIAGPDFGIGSSRETAVWALWGAGIRAVVAPSFGDIFRTNCVRNSLLTAIAPIEDIEQLWTGLEAQPGATVQIDLVAAQLTGPADLPVALGMDGFARRCLIEGVDEFGLLESYQDDIDHLLSANAVWSFRTDRIVEDGAGANGESRG